jgi:hypothetical protein
VLALALGCHYFGILVAVPLLLAEAVRTVRQRRLDLPVTAVLLASYLPVISWLPYLHGAAQYKAHYYIQPDFMKCIRSYSWLDEINRAINRETNRGANAGLSDAANVAMFLVIVATVMVGAYFGCKASRGRDSRGEDSKAEDPHALDSHALDSRALDSRAEEWLVLVFMALLPVFGGMLSVAGAGSFLPRYVIGSSIGLMVPRIAGILYFLRSRMARRLILVVMCVLIVAGFARDNARNRRDAGLLRFCLANVSPNTLVVPDDYNDFMRLHYYDGHNFPAGSSYAWVADMQRELAWEHTDDVSRTMLNMRQFSDIPVMPYEELLRSRRPIELIQTKGNKRDWLVRQLVADHARITLIASERDHSIYRVELASPDR